MKKRRVVCAAMAAVMAMSLAACGGSDTASATTAAGEASESEETAAEGSSEGVFVIGGSGPLTGGSALYGTAVKNGGQVAVDEINANGGINGYQVKWIFEDDEADGEKAVNAYNTLKDEGMQMFVGTTTSGACMSVIAETENDNMFQITPSGSAVECAANPNVFRVCFSDPDQGRASAQYIGEHELATKVGVIYDSSTDYSTGIYEAFAAEAANQPFEVVSVEAFTADSKTDFSVQVQKSKEAGADLLFMPFYYTEASLVLAECDKQGYEPTFFGCDGMDGILGVENFDVALAEGLTFLAPFVAKSEDEMVQNFVTKYEEAYGETPNQFAADAYDSVYVVKAAIEAAGATPDMSVSDLCDAMMGAMSSVTYDGVTGKSITWTDGEPNKAPLVVQVSGGEYTEL